MKKYRLYTSNGNYTIESESIKYKKSKSGLTVTPKNGKKIEGVIIISEIQESEIVVASPQNNSSQDDEMV
jgi:hypothetical protein